ncbi:MAG TPA: hypothetical protein VMJ10_17495 [Kofleriaceae bacterium]|nr:hypothetical protein [Kofleriaceae bacterium]
MNKLSLMYALAGLAACGTTNSDSLLTSGMSADMTVTGNADGTATVTVNLFSGDPDQLIFVNLDDGDTLVGSNASQSLPLVEQQLVTIIDYSAQFITGTEGAQYTIDLERTVDAGAPSSTATLPAPFALGEVATSASRASDLAITWSPAGAADPMTWQIEGTCIEGASGTIDGDPGAQTIAGNTLVKASGNGVPDSCTATLTVARTRVGQLDPHFGHGGSIVGEQARTATFTTTP